MFPVDISCQFEHLLVLRLFLRMSFDSFSKSSSEKEHKYSQNDKEKKDISFVSVEIPVVIGFKAEENRDD